MKLNKRRMQAFARSLVIDPKDTRIKLLLTVADTNFYATRAIEFLLAGDLTRAGEMLVLANESQATKS